MNQSRRDSGQVVKEPGKPALGKSVTAVLMDVGVPAEVEISETGGSGVGGLGDPGLMINEAVGPAPTKEMLKKWLVEAICQNNNKEETDGQFKN